MALGQNGCQEIVEVVLQVLEVVLVVPGSCCWFPGRPMVKISKGVLKEL